MIAAGAGQGTDPAVGPELVVGYVSPLGTDDDATLDQNLRSLTTWMVERYTDLGLLDNYLDGYAVAGDRLM